MRTLLPSIALGLALTTVTPIVTYAATPYFESGGVSSFDFITNSRGGIDIALVHRGPAEWFIVNGRLPNGVVLTNLGGSSTISRATIEGTATEEGVFPVRIMAMVASVPYFLDFTVRAYNQPLTIEPIGVAQGRVGLPYSQPLTVSGSASIHSAQNWSIAEGSLPPGLTLNSTTGEISGTPTTAGSFRYLVRMYEQGGYNRTANPREYLHTIQPASSQPVQITTRTAPVAGQVGSTYPAQLFRATGGSGTYRWAVTLGSLPPGLSLDATSGILSGTPTTAGTYPVNIKAYDQASELNSDSFSFSISVASAPAPAPTSPTAPTLGTTSVAQGTVGQAYSTTLAASGGSTPYVWNFASGSLPPGLSLSSSGVVSGTPTSAGSYSAYIEVFGANGLFSGRTLTFTIAAAPSTTPTPPPTTPSTPALSAELTNRLNNLNRMGVEVHALVKLPDDGNRFTQEDSAVYYIGADGRRHAFPNDRVFFSWYSSFDSVRTVSASNLASIPLGANVTYKPGVKMAKFTTDPKVYAIDTNRALRWIKTETAATALYGSSWNRQIDDIADTFYTDYTFGADINTALDYDRNNLSTTIRFVSDVLPL